MYKFTEESKLKIKEYSDNQYLSDDIFKALWTATKKDQIIASFQKELTINEFNISKVWGHIVENIWTTMEEIFAPYEILLLKELLSSDGVLTLTYTRNRLLSPHLTAKSLDKLTSKGIVDILTLKTKEKIIILHPKFRHEIFEEEE